MTDFTKLPEAIAPNAITRGGSRFYVCERETTSGYVFGTYIDTATGLFESGITAKHLGRIGEEGVTYTWTAEDEITEEDSLAENVYFSAGSKQMAINIASFLHTEDESILRFVDGAGATTAHIYFEFRYLNNDVTAKPEIYMIYDGKFGYAKTVNHQPKESKKITGLVLNPTAQAGEFYAKYVWDSVAEEYILDNTYLPDSVTIATSTTIAFGATTPEIEVTADQEFLAPDNSTDLTKWEIDEGTTSLTVATIVKTSAKLMTFTTTGTAAGGTITIKTKNTGFDPRTKVSSNTLSIVVPAS